MADMALMPFYLFQYLLIFLNFQLQLFLLLDSHITQFVSLSTQTGQK